MTWIINEDEFSLNPDAAASVFTVGNGAICTRGTPGEADRGQFRGVYVSGAFTTAPYGNPYPFTAPDWTRSAWSRTANACSPPRRAAGSTCAPAS